MKYSLLIIMALSIEHACRAQFKITKPDSAELPKAIAYKGHIVNAARWVDSMGDNIMILTETGIYPSGTTPDDNGYSNDELYAFHYLVLKDSLKLIWKVHDYVDKCDLDMKANFIENTFSVTDLDKDGNAEIWLMYKVGCYGDVSPIPMKIVMYEGDKKFAARGTNKVNISANKYTGGEYSFDNAFKNSSEAFRKFANDLWQKNILEKWE